MKLKTKNEEMIFRVVLEKSRINREKSTLILNKALLLYFTLLFVGIIGFISGYIQSFLLNVLIIMGLCVLIIGTLPFIRIMYDEERKLDSILDELKK